MKKKLVVCILCGMMAMSALTCGIGSVFAAESPETPVISAQEGEQIPNPWKEYTSVKDAENAVGFSVKLPKKDQWLYKRYDSGSRRISSAGILQKRG